MRTSPLTSAGAEENEFQPSSYESAASQQPGLVRRSIHRNADEADAAGEWRNYNLDAEANSRSLSTNAQTVSSKDAEDEKHTQPLKQHLELPLPLPASNRQNFPSWSSYFALPDLHEFSQLPEDVKQSQSSNIHTGYRVEWSALQCFLSIFTLHNETVNIHTALIGVALSLWTLQWLYNRTDFTVATNDATLNFDVKNYIRFNAVEFAMMTIFLLASTASYAASFVYHTFSAMSASVADKLLRLDLSCIILLIIGSFFPAMYWTFACQPRALDFYLGISTILGFLVFKFTMSSKTDLRCCASHSRSSHNYPATPHQSEILGESFFGKMLRTVLFSSLALFGVLPMIHILSEFGVDSPRILGSTVAICMTYFAYGIGIVVYLLRWPEKHVKRAFDIIGQSHNLWHLFVLLGTTVHFFACMHLAYEHKTEGCVKPQFNTFLSKLLFVEHN